MPFHHYGVLIRSLLYIFIYTHRAYLFFMACNFLQIQCLVRQHMQKQCYFVGTNVSSDAISNYSTGWRSSLAEAHHDIESGGENFLSMRSRTVL